MDESNIKARLIFINLNFETSSYFSKYWQVQTKLVFAQTVTYVTIVSQAQVGYHCYYTRVRVKPNYARLSVNNNDIL